MILLGMTGPIGHGKSSFADALVQAEPTTRQFETFTVIAEVVDLLHQALGPVVPSPDDLTAVNAWLAQLPTIVGINLGRAVTFEQIELTRAGVAGSPVEFEKLFQHLRLLAAQPELARQPITPENKSTYRPILQWVGGFLISRLGPIWWEEVIRRMRVAADNGAKVCVAAALRYPDDANLLRQAGGKVVKIYRPDQSDRDTADPTERERSAITPDITISNSDTMADLVNTAEKLLADLQSGQPHVTYDTAKVSAGLKNLRNITP